MTASSGVVLSNLAYLIGAVVLAIIGGLAVWWHHRQPKSVDANVESFHRGLRALAPESLNTGPARHSGAGPTEGYRIRPRSGVTLHADEAGQEAPGPVEQPEAQPVVVDLPRQGTQHQAAAGDGAGDRPGAETG